MCCSEALDSCISVVHYLSAIGADKGCFITVAGRSSAICIEVALRINSNDFAANSCYMSCRLLSLDYCTVNFAVFGNCYPCLLVSMAVALEQCLNLCDFSLEFVCKLLALSNSSYGSFALISCAINESRLATVLANCIAPAVILAGGCNFNYILSINMLESSFGLVVIKAVCSSAVCTISNCQASVCASCFLNNNSRRILADCAPIALFSKSSNRNVAGNFTVSLVDHCIDARLLCSSVCLDVDDSLSRIGYRCLICQSGSRNQRCDHENSHQHAQQSLFHFLLFTSV